MNGMGAIFIVLKLACTPKLTDSLFRQMALT